MTVDAALYFGPFDPEQPTRPRTTLSPPHPASLCPVASDLASRPDVVPFCHGVCAALPRNDAAIFLCESLGHYTSREGTWTPGPPVIYIRHDNFTACIKNLVLVFFVGIHYILLLLYITYIAYICIYNREAKIGEGRREPDGFFFVAAEMERMVWYACFACPSQRRDMICSRLFVGRRKGMRGIYLRLGK